MKRKARFYPFLILTVAASLAMSACGGREDAKGGEPRPVLPVRVATVESHTRIATEDAAGTVQARMRATIEAKISGRVLSLPVSAGDTVRKGDILVEIDAREIRARLEQARARLEQAKRDRDRMAKLLARQSVTQSSYDDAEARYRVARATVEEVETVSGYTKLLAPFDGVVSGKFAEVGDMAVPGKPLLILDDPDSVQIEVFISEALIAAIHSGDELAVDAPSLNEPLVATVREIAPAADPATRTFRVKLALADGSGLRLGQFVRVAVPVGEVTAPQVPASAVVVRGQLEMVFVVEDATAHMRLVKTGRRSGDSIEILSGLSAGEQVVVAAPAPLLDGQAVEIR